MKHVQDLKAQLERIQIECFSVIDAVELQASEALSKAEYQQALVDYYEDLVARLIVENRKLRSRLPENREECNETNK